MQSNNDKWMASNAAMRVLDPSVLPEVPKPKVPNFRATGSCSLADKLEMCQRFIDALEYNHTGHSFFSLDKSRTVSRIVEAGKLISQECLPIKCLEAVFLSLYLTRDLKEVYRIPLSFTSQMDSHVHRHIVCGLYDGTTFGALGLSRRKELGFKPFCFDSLYAMIMDYAHGYQQNYHSLFKVRIGLPVPHDTSCQARIWWKFVTIRIDGQSEEYLRKAFASVCRHLDACYQEYLSNPYLMPVSRKNIVRELGIDDTALDSSSDAEADAPKPEKKVTSTSVDVDLTAAVISSKPQKSDAGPPKRLFSTMRQKSTTASR
jgi:hypothetical protein